MKYIDPKYPPLLMEDHFVPGIKWTPLLLFGSQTHKIWSNSAKLQAPEDFFLAALKSENIAVVRNMDPNYINYFQNLTGGQIINISNIEKETYLTEAILKNEWALQLIQDSYKKDLHLLPFMITPMEVKLSNKLHMPFYGNKKTNDLFGTKSGIRRLASQYSLPIPPGHVCASIEEIDQALKSLQHNFKFAAIKHDESVSGFLSKKVSTTACVPTQHILRQILKRPFEKGKDIVVVEGWIHTPISVGTHIEILPNKETFLCAAWQQVIDKDGVSYVGAGPLHISPSALSSLKKNMRSLARALVDKGAFGSYGPDFLITSQSESNLKPDSAILIELNTRIPYTAFPLEIVKNIKGTIGSGFYSTHIHLNKPLKFIDVFTVLRKANLLITHKSPTASGVVPFGISMLPWKSFTIIAIADSWSMAQYVARKTQTLFDAI